MRSAIKQYVKSNFRLKRLALCGMRLIAPFAQLVNFRAVPRYVGFFSDWKKFNQAGGEAPFLDLYPCLFDRTTTSGIDCQYFYQAVWALQRIRDAAPVWHVDVGSPSGYVGTLTTVTKVIFIDIRPLKVMLPNYLEAIGSLLALPFGENSVRSLSCLHVIEHVGLGRYGDPIEPQGPERSCAEIIRVLKPGGYAYISIPLGRPRVAFNGLRVFSAPEVVYLFKGLNLVEMALVDALGEMHAGVDPSSVVIGEEVSGNDFGLGLFTFSKPVPEKMT